MRPEDEDRIAAQLARVMAVACVRNTQLETLHAGQVPASRTGDGSKFWRTDIMTEWGGCAKRTGGRYSARSRQSHATKRVAMDETDFTGTTSCGQDFVPVGVQ